MMISRINEVMRYTNMYIAIKSRCTDNSFGDRVAAISSNIGFTTAFGAYRLTERELFIIRKHAMVNGIGYGVQKK